MAAPDYWKLTFDRDGLLTDPQPEMFLSTVGTSEPCDLFVFSHGWGSSVDAATAPLRLADRFGWRVR